MRIPVLKYPYFLAAAVASFALACGGGDSSSSSPTSVTSGSPVATASPDAAASPAEPPAATGARIVGTVQASGVAGAAPADVQANSTSLRVTVVGTSVSATTDAGGHFTLDNVPTGSVQLRFEGHGCDARLGLDGLRSGQTLTITVRVSGSNASLMHDGDDEGHAEVEGTVGSVSGNQLVVSGTTVMVDGATRIVGHEGTTLALADIKVGARVEVEGTKQADGSILAAKIELEGEHDGDGHGGDGHGGHEVEFSGRVESVGSGQLVVSGKTVMVDGDTRIVGPKGTTLALADIKVGARVEVEGTKQADATILAAKIKLER